MGERLDTWQFQLDDYERWSKTLPKTQRDKLIGAIADYVFLGIEPDTQRLPKAVAAAFDGELRRFRRYRASVLNGKKSGRKSTKTSEKPNENPSKTYGKPDENLQETRSVNPTQENDGNHSNLPAVISKLGTSLEGMLGTPLDGVLGTPIIKNENDNKNKNESESVTPARAGTEGRPSGLTEVKEYAEAEGLHNFNPTAFHAYYEANGWTAGGRPIKDWRAKAREWSARDASTSEGRGRAAFEAVDWSAYEPIDEETPDRAKPNPTEAGITDQHQPQSGEACRQASLERLAAMEEDERATFDEWCELAGRVRKEGNPFGLSKSERSAYIEGSHRGWYALWDALKVTE